MEQNRAAISPFSKRSTFLNHSISAVIQRPINRASETNQYMYILFDLFSKDFVTVPDSKTKTHYAVRLKVPRSISNISPLHSLITD